VIAIIAILAAILFPVFAQAREKARQIACLTGTRQLGTAVMMYMQDNDEMTPLMNQGTANGSACPCWPDMLQSYIKSASFMFGCPSVRFTTPWTPGSKVGIAFSFNALYTSGGTSPDGQETTPPAGAINNNPQTPTSLAQYAVPAGTIVFGDANGSYMIYSSNKTATTVSLKAPYADGVTYPNPGRSGTGTNNTGQRYVARHSQGSNFVFADGHAKWMTLDQAGRMNRNGVMYQFTLEDDESW
jgi:prepilin-type processing-associated H-X9-DG protein